MPPGVPRGSPRRGPRAAQPAHEIAKGRGTYVKIKQTLTDSFSAVSKPNFASTKVVNIRWKALDEIYKMYTLLHRSDLNISATLPQIFGVFNGRHAKQFAFFQNSSQFSVTLMKFAQRF